MAYIEEQGKFKPVMQLLADHGFISDSTLIIAHTRMLDDNPEMTQREMDAGMALMKTMGIADSGDSLKRGIGTMNAARVKDFYSRMVEAGLYRADEVDLGKVANYHFIDHGVGLELKTQLATSSATAH